MNENTIRMKKILFAIALFSFQFAASQEPSQPQFQGAGVEHFIRRLAGEAKKIAIGAENDATDDLSETVVFRGEVDTAGVFRIVRFLDETCSGSDFRNVPPPTPYTRELVGRAVEKLERWTPAADEEGGPVVYPMTVRLRLPVREILVQRDLRMGTPLLFQKDDPNKTFRLWLNPRIGSLETGSYLVKFYIEPDGSVSDITVIESPSEKEGRKLARIIRASGGQWTPKKMDGVCVRTSYEYRLNMQYFE